MTCDLSVSIETRHMDPRERECEYCAIQFQYRILSVHHNKHNVFECVLGVFADIIIVYFQRCLVSVSPLFFLKSPLNSFWIGDFFLYPLSCSHSTVHAIFVPNMYFIRSLPHKNTFFYQCF